MEKNRLEAFSDGVIAIIITIMVLELKVPHGHDLQALLPLLPVFLSYVLSFIYVGIYWNNHHHMLQTLRHVNGAILWANLHWLFWLSLFPFTTAWMGENHFETMPLIAYGFVLLMTAIAYFILQASIIKSHGNDSVLAKAIGRDLKGKLSPVIYLGAMLVACVSPKISGLMYVLVACIWLIPDRRIERMMTKSE